MKPADCYHVGLVVEDIATAAARLTAAMGYQWTNPVEATLSVTTADGDTEVPFRFVYSVSEPHLELIQEVPGTIWTAPAGGAAHHLGYWVDDLAAAAAEHSNVPGTGLRRARAATRCPCSPTTPTRPASASRSWTERSSPTGPDSRNP